MQMNQVEAADFMLETYGRPIRFNGDCVYCGAPVEGENTLDVDDHLWWCSAMIALETLQKISGRELSDASSQ